MNEPFLPPHQSPSPTPPPPAPPSLPGSDQTPTRPPLPTPHRLGPPIAPPGGAGPFDPGSSLPSKADPADELWPTPSEPPPRSREGLWLALAAIVSALLVIGGALAWQALRSDGETAADAPTTSSGETPATSTTVPSGESASPTTSPPTSAPEGGVDAEVEHVACPAEVPADICSAAAFVETFRGRPFKTFPTVQLVDDDAFVQRLLRDFDDDRPEIETTNEVWRSLGFIGPEDDLGEILATSWEIGTVGAYFADTKELYVEGDELDLYARMVVVHELTHAHDDQWLDLDREEYEEATDEIAYGFSAVVEGNAQRVEKAWRAALGREEQDRLAELEAGFLSPEDIRVYTSLPQMLLFLQISPYVDGAALVDVLAGDDGEDAVDAAITDPPTTSEEVLHPELYGRTQAIEVPVPPTDGSATVLDEGVVGELVFDLWFSQKAGDGWGGDHYVTWSTGSGACTRVDVVGDTATDTDQLEAAATKWASTDESRSVERVGAANLDVVRITGCY